MPALERKLIHPDHRDPREVHRPQSPLERALVDVLDRLPVQSEIIGPVPDRHHRAQPRDALGQTPRHPRVRIEPSEQLELRPAVRARHSDPWELKLHGVLEHRQIPHGAPLRIVQCRRFAPAAAAVCRPAPIPPQPQHAPTALATALLAPPTELIPFPSAEGGNTLFWGHGRPPACLMPGNAKLAEATVRLTPRARRPRKREKNLIVGVGRHAWIRRARILAFIAGAISPWLTLSIGRIESHFWPSFRETSGPLDAPLMSLPRLGCALLAPWLAGRAARAHAPVKMAPQ